MIDREALQQGKDAASQARALGGHGTAPIANISTALDRSFAGRLWVVSRPLDGGPEGALLRTPRRWVAVVNSHQQNLAKQRFTAAHEGGHYHFDRERAVLLDDKIVTNSSTPPNEQRANSFAIHFLLPVSALTERNAAGILDTNKPESVVRLAFEYGVSYQATVFHLLNSRLISQTHSQKLLAEKPWKLAQQLGLREKVRAEVAAHDTRTYPTEMTGIVQRAIDAGKISEDEARRLLSEDFESEWETLFDDFDDA